MAKIIVVGGAGQLGQCLQQVVREQNIPEVFFLPKAQSDILDPEKLQAVFQEYQPSYCINCAAYTAVDKAEDEADLARQVNRDGVENLSRLCRDFNTTLIHISTDFVFSGTHHLPLTEEAPTGPINVYGLTKLEGERVIPSYTEKFFVLRTSWLYSEYGNNFVKTMLRLGKEKEELRIIWDQVGSPTYAMDLAACIFTIIQTQSQAYGIYHYSNEGITSWYDFAMGIFELSQTQVRVLPVRSVEYVTKAARPAYSVMDKAKIKQSLNLHIPYWRESLARCLQRLG